MDQGPLYAVGRPTSFSRAGIGGAFLPETAPAGTGALSVPMPTAPIFDNGPSFNASYVPGQTNYFDQGVQNINGRVVWHMAQNLSSWQKGDTCGDHITFVRRLSPGSARAASGPVSYPMMCLTTINWLLQHDAGTRRKYDSIDCAAVMRDFGYVGVQQSKQAGLSAGSFNDENNFVRRGRAVMPNIWLACQRRGAVRQLHTVGLVLRRRRYRGNDALDPAAWNMRAPQTTVEARKAHTLAPSMIAPQTARLKRNISLVDPADASRKLARLSDRTAAVLAVVQVDKPSTHQYYWCFEPYVTVNRAPPSPCVYMGDPGGDPHNQFIGDFILVGQVLHNSTGTSECTTQQMSKAREVVYADTRSEDYIPAFRALNTIEVHLDVGHSD